MSQPFSQLSGLVLRAEPSGDTGVRLAVLTHEMGLQRLKARGAKRRGSKLLAYTQPLVYANFTVFDFRGHLMLNDAEARSFFAVLRTDLRKLALGIYFAEVAERLSEQDRYDDAPLRLTLKALDRLCAKPKETEKTKAAFEWRAAALAGYRPHVETCAVCGHPPQHPVMQIGQGHVYCRDCQSPGETDAVPLEFGGWQAVRHVVSCPDNRVFAFETNAKGWQTAGEQFLQTQLAHQFAGLTYYKGLEQKYRG